MGNILQDSLNFVSLLLLVNKKMCCLFHFFWLESSFLFIFSPKRLLIWFSLSQNCNEWHIIFTAFYLSIFGVVLTHSFYGFGHGAISFLLSIMDKMENYYITLSLHDIWSCVRILSTIRENTKCLNESGKITNLPTEMWHKQNQFYFSNHKIWFMFCAWLGFGVT